MIKLEHDGYIEPIEAQDRPWHLTMTTREASLFARGVACYTIRHGKSISIHPAPSANDTMLRLFLVGNALGILLYQRGYLVLHASAVALHGVVVAFLGQSGQGKSTTAAAFHQAGYKLVTDDILAVNVNASPVTVLPAFPKIKLHQEVIDSMAFHEDAINMIHPQLAKQRFDVSSAFSTEPLPLKHVYLLAESDSLAIEPMLPQEAIISLVSHSYVTQKTSNAPHLAQCATVAGKVPVFRLKRPLSLERLPQVVNLIKEHSVANQ